MKSEHSLREISDPGIQVVDAFYHRIEGYHIAGNLLIFASDYQSLKKTATVYSISSKINSVLSTKS